MTFPQDEAGRPPGEVSLMAGLPPSRPDRTREAAASGRAHDLAPTPRARVLDDVDLALFIPLNFGPGPDLADEWDLDETFRQV
jgi:hypothetical protein